MPKLSPPLSVKVIAFIFFANIPLSILGIFLSPGLALFTIPRDFIPIYLEMLRFWIVMFKLKPEFSLFFLQFYVIFVILFSIVGYGLLKLRKWARLLGTILAFFNLGSFPIGTIISGFIIGSLLSQEVSRAFGTTGLWPIRKIKTPLVVISLFSVISIVGVLLLPPVWSFVSERLLLVPQVYYELGRAYQQGAESFDDSSIYDLTTQLNPNSASAYYNRGNIAYSKGDYDQAIADYSQVIKLEPDNVFAYHGRGLAYCAKGDDYRAMLDYNRAIQINPDYDRVYNDRGNLFYNKNEYERAIADYDQAIQLAPDNANAYFGRGLAYQFKGDKEKAIADFEQFLNLSNDPYWRANAEKELQALKGQAQ